MNIYLDNVFFENFILNILILYQVSIFSKNKIKLNKAIIASLIAAIYSTLLVILKNTFLSNILLKILVINIVVYLCFIPKTLKKFLKLQAYYYIIFFIYIGAIISISTFLKLNLSNVGLKVFIYIIGYIITYLSNKKMWKMWKSNIKNDSYIYELFFKINNKNIKIRGFVDTGNNLKDEINNLDIFVIENTKEFNEKMMNNFQKINVEMYTVNSNCFLKGYIIDNIFIKKNNKYVTSIDKAIIVFIDKKLSINDEYRSLISYDTYIDKLQGVIL